jgi:small subunit ribosomal protein S6
MNNYESVFIARADLSSAQVEELAGKLEEIIKEGKGEVKSKDFWGLKTLAYPIAKNRKGYYTIFEISAPPAAIAEFERKMRLDESILRYMTVRIEPKSKKALAAAAKRQSRKPEREPEEQE